MSNLGVNEILALLDRLESAIRTFASREEKLNGEYRSRSSATVKAFDKTAEERASQLAERISTVPDHRTGLASTNVRGWCL